MKKQVVLFLILITSFCGFSQNIHWADTILAVSSERKLSHHFSKLHPHAYSAEMALGMPNIMPGNEGTAKVWTPKDTDGREFIHVGFSNPIIVRQIAIAETFNPTAIVKITLFNTTGDTIRTYNIEPKQIPLPGRLFNIFIDATSEKTASIKVDINGSITPGYNGIDAIGISDSHIPIGINATIAEGLHTAIDPEKLNDNINSPFKDLKPLISPDGNTMFFSRIKHPENIGGTDDLEDIWISERNEETNEWSKAKNAGEPLNNDGPNFISSLTPTGYAYLLLLGNQYHKEDKMKDGLSITTKTSNGFSKPEPVIIREYENYSRHANFYLAPGGMILLMSVHRRETYGLRDLYVSFLENDGTWSIPKNLGEQINTGEEESSPFLALDSRTLYFSSKGHLGYGGSDVFVTKRLDDTWTNWSEPENLGTAVNSKEDEMFFYLTESDSKYAYFTRGNGADADIYRLLLPAFQMPEPTVILKGRVLNVKTMKPIGDARITFKDPDHNVIVYRQYSEHSTGRYKANLPLGNLYTLYATAENYVSLESEKVDLTAIYEPDTIERDIFLKPLEVGQRIALDKIYFDFDKSSLKPESIPELQIVTDFLKTNPKVKIELDGHTCSIGTEDYNKRLSEARAKSVRRYLLDKGIDRQRVTSMGFGEANPLASNENERGRAENRRVEFIILEK